MEEWILAQDGITLYLSLFVLLMGGVFGLPIPEDIPLVLAGILLQLGKCALLPVFLVCYGAIVLGDIIIFGIGRYFGPKLFKKRWFDKREIRTKLKRIRVGLERKSVLMIFIARHLFYIRTLTFLSCGALKMRFLRFLVADAIAALISVPIMISLGYFAADNYDHLKHYIEEAKFFSIVVGVLGIVSFYYYRRARLRKEAIEEVLDEEPLKPLE